MEPFGPRRWPDPRELRGTVAFALPAPRRGTPVARRGEILAGGEDGRQQGPGSEGARAGTWALRMFPQGRHPSPLQPGQPFEFSVLEIYDRIKEELQFLQAQYHSLKLECEKLMSEKTEMQRHYVMSISCSPPESLQDEEWMGLKQKREEKNLPGHSDSDGDKSDHNLVVDEDPTLEPGSPGYSPSSQLAPIHWEMPESLASTTSSGNTTPLGPKGQCPTDCLLDSASTSKPSASSPSHNSLTPGPGPSSAVLLQQPPTKAPTTDTITLHSPLNTSRPYMSSFGLVPHTTQGGAPSPQHVPGHLPLTAGQQRCAVQPVPDGK